MWNWTQRTWHISRDCPAVLSDVPDTHEVKESAQQADGWAQQEAVLQAAEAPVRRLRVHALYAVGNLRAHRWRWNWASVSGGREDTSAAIYLRSCGWRSTHQSHKVGTSWVPQEVDDCDLESFGRWPSVWYDDVLKWKGTKNTLLVSSVFPFPPMFCLFTFHASLRLTSSMSAMTAQFRATSVSPKATKTCNAWCKSLKSVFYSWMTNTWGFSFEMVSDIITVTYSVWFGVVMQRQWDIANVPVLFYFPKSSPGYTDRNFGLKFKVVA